MKKVLFSIFALILTGCTFFSCFTDVGLGTIDTEAPVISITKLSSGESELNSFEGGIYCKRNVVFSGTATDNRQVTRVYAELRWGGQESFTSIGNAAVQGTDWTFDYNFEAEGACYIRFVAEDNARNTSTKSVKTITLFVDETAPVANAWYIDRELNGIQYNLKEKDFLESLDLTLPENKDAAQNVSFTLCANASDTFGVSSVTLKIKDENGDVVAEIENSNPNNIYAPKFKVTHDILVNGKSSLASGKHYLQICYDAEDIVEFPASNTVEDAEVSAGWFIWWPENDVPQITNSEIYTNSEDNDLALNAHVKDLLCFTFFDDDELNEGYFALLTSAEKQAFTSTWNEIKENPELIIQAVKADAINGEETDDDARNDRACHFVSNGERDKNIVLKAATEAQTMQFVAIGWDNTTAKRIVTKEVSVRVTDENTPILLIASPKNNSIPTFNEGEDTTTVTGQSFDSTGCTYLEFVWIPNSLQNGYQMAKDWLDSLTTEEAHESLLKASNNLTVKDGLKLWAVELSEKVSQNSFYTQNYSFDLDLLEDFVYGNNNEKAESKKFLIKLTRKDGNYIYQDYTLEPDDLPPTIVGVTPSVDMQIVQNDKDLTLKFYAEKESGLRIDTSKYKITCITSETEEGQEVSKEQPVDGSYNDTTGYYEAEVTKETLTDLNANAKIPKYRFYAEDIFGNSNYVEYSLVISDLPNLKSISATTSGNCKLGDKIDIVATFSKIVGVSGSPYIKLKGIKNEDLGITEDDIVKAYYAGSENGGSGTTSIHFTYTVQAGDSSDGLKLYDSRPIEDNNSNSFIDEKVSINELSTAEDSDCKNLFDAKEITIDGIIPTIKNIAFTGTGPTYDEITYLNEGTTITAVLTLSEKVLVGSPSPELILYVRGDASKTVTLPFTNLSSTSSNTKITFSKTVEAGDNNGLLYYDKQAWLNNYSSIYDLYGNSITNSSTQEVASSNLYIDTVVPKTPVVAAVNSDGETIDSFETISDAKYKNYVNVILTKAETDSSIKWLQYSIDGGSTWLPDGASAEGVAQKITSSGSFTYRAIDKAGNISSIPESIYLDIESTFPKFEVECINPDGNYKLGDVLTLRVSFERDVSVASGAGAYITVNGKKANLSSSTAQSQVDSVDFKYIVSSGDDFTLSIAKAAVVLTGISDMYGITQGSKTLETAYTRSGIKCDGIVPTVSSMVPGGETSSGSNVYESANVITLTFSEPVLKGSGNITLRRAGTWAIPPVLSVSDFNKICGAITSEQKNTLSLQENGTDMEDSEWVAYNGSYSSSTYENKYYHGTGQYVGPYKVMSQGINDDGTPDTTTKYVLDFDMDIWDTDTAHYFGKTFTSSTQTSPTTLNASNATKITVGDIRSVLESAHYHERILDASASAVKISDDGKTVTITFPAGLCDTSASLPDGIEWELLIDSGCFMDECGNEYVATSSKAVSTSNGKPTFLSSGVQTPVIRVNRYSYGLGIKQSTSTGGTSSVTGVSTAPTGYVRTRIDCQTPNVTIKYGISGNDVSNTILTSGPDGRSCSYKFATATNTTTSSLAGITLNTEYTSVFACGNGKYDTAYRGYVVAQATDTNDVTSDKSYEGIFQSVVKYDFSTWGSKPSYISIRGTTGWSGEPSISPFPLRDAQVGSPYIRICYNSGNTYHYWVSYEVLTDASFSGYANGYSNNYFSSWGYLYTGGYSVMSGIKLD